MDAIFNVLKPPKMTSHDVIGFLRRALNTKKIGHGGTLDPDAAGVLPVFAGSATRLLEFAVEGRKEYIAEFTLGAQTDTGDDSGEVVKTLPVPQFTQEQLLAVLAQFIGPQLQLRTDELRQHSQKLLLRKLRHRQCLDNLTAVVTGISLRSQRKLRNIFLASFYGKL